MKLNLSQVKSCGQIWDDMPECEGGRKCQECQHVIHDFRGLSDFDIALIHHKSNTKVCGIYDENKLSNESAQPTITRQIKKGGMALASLVGLAIVQPNLQAQAQEAPKVIQTSEQENKQEEQAESKQSDPTNLKDSITIKGVLRDMNKEPIMGGTLFIRETEQGTITDLNGQFNLTFTNLFENTDSLTLIASYIGYGDKAVTITKADCQGDNELNIEMDVTLDEQIHVTVFGVTRPPWYKRVWYSIRDIFRK